MSLTRKARSRLEIRGQCGVANEDQSTPEGAKNKAGMLYGTWRRFKSHDEKIYPEPAWIYALPVPLAVDEVECRTGM